MLTIDDVIKEFKRVGFEKLHPSIPQRDLKILKSIANLLSKDTYITQSQGNLLIKILNENLNFLKNTVEELEVLTQNPIWSKSFREIQNSKKIYILNKENIVIEFSYKKEVKKILDELYKKLNDEAFVVKSNQQFYSLREKNVILIYDTLKSQNFQFSEDFLELYEKIKSLNLEEICQKFQFNNLYREKIQSSSIPNIEPLANDKKLIILDRKIRYQYKFEENFDQAMLDSLSYKIANRQLPKIFTNNIKISFNDIIQSLIDLERTKILVIFDEFSISDCVSNLNKLSRTLKKFDLDNNVGIYFRFDNKGDGVTFNNIISSNEYNKKLDKNTNIVGISNGKIPKFMLNNDWYPDAVISFTTNLRNNRTDVYCNNCDLVVYYTNTKPLSIKCDEIL